MKKIYISGKISGKFLQKAEEDFGAYAEIIQAAGHTPVNPMKNGLPFDAPWEDHMERDLEMLRASDAICLLPDWVDSCGAKIELQHALESRMPVLNDSNLCQYLEIASQQGVQMEVSPSKILRNIENSYQKRQAIQNKTNSISEKGRTNRD